MYAVFNRYNLINIKSRIASFLKFGISIWILLHIREGVLAQQCLHSFIDHTNNVSVAFHPDGKLFLSGGGDNTMKLWDAQAKKSLRSFKHADLVAGVAFHPLGDKALSGSYDRSIKLWEVATGKLLRHFTGHIKEVMSVAFSPDGSKIVSASFDETIKLWDPNSGTCLRTFTGHVMGVNSVVFNFDGKQILSGSYDSTIRLWDVNTGTCLRTFKGHSKGITMVAFSPNGRHVISSSYDSTLKLWDLNTGVCLRTFRDHKKGVTSVSFSSDGKQVLSSSYDKTVKLWNVLTGICVHTFIGHTDEVNSAIFHPKGNEGLSGSQDNTIRQWKIPERPARIIHDEVQKKMIVWLQKGKYETSIAYQQRTSQTSRRQAAEALAQPLIDSLAYLKTNHFNVFMGDYDTENQVFELSFESQEIAPFYLHVPLKEAEAFDNHFESIDFHHPKFAFNDKEEFVLLHVEVVNPHNSKTYVYNKTATNWSALPFATAEIKADHTKVTHATNMHASLGSKPPFIEVVQPKIDRGKQYHHEEKKMTIKGNVKADGGLFMLLVNGVETSVSQDGTFHADVPIGYNENTVYLKAVDKHNQVSIDSILVYRAFDNSKSIIEGRKGNDYALVIATDEYQEYKNLSNPIHDGLTIAKELESNYGFQVEIVKNPSHSDMYKVLRSYSKKQFADGDQLFIFVAGHGEFDPVFSEGYIVASDSKLNDEIKESFVSHSNVRTIVNNIPCKHVFLMLDVCFGGTFDQSISNMRGGENPNVVEREKFIQRKLALTTRKYITSGGKEYVPDGRPGFHSPFASKFIESLRTYGSEDKILTFNELYNHLERVVPGPKAGEFGNNQPGSDFLFIAK